MKRSEMLTKLAQLLSPEYTENGFFDESHYDKAGEILSMLESRGMKPPKTVLRDVVFAPEACAWESENDSI